MAEAMNWPTFGPSARSGTPLEGPKCICTCQFDIDNFLDNSARMLDVDDVAILDDVVLGLLPHQASGFDLAFTSQANEVCDAHRFGPNEAAGQVGVDAVGRFKSGAAL